MEQSESVTELLTALCAARLEFQPIARNREGFSKRGGQKYGYADLNAIIDATAPAMAKHGLTMMQFLEDGPESTQASVKSILFHLSGQWMASQLTVLRPNDPQEFGIVTTYTKRYMQQAMLNISTEEDDQDGKLPAEETKATRRESASRQPTQAAPPTLITYEELTSLAQLAEAAGLDTVKRNEDMRLLFGMEPGEKLNRKIIRDTMTRAQFEERWQRYTDLIEANQDIDVPDFSGPTDAMVPTTDTTASGEGPEPSEPDDAVTGKPEGQNAKHHATVEQLDGLEDLAREISEASVEEVQRMRRVHHGQIDLSLYHEVRNRLSAQKETRLTAAKVY